MASPRFATSKTRKRQQQDRGPRSQRGRPIAPLPPSRWRTLRAAFWPETKRGQLALLAILLVALCLRGYRLLTLFPVLLDESIYLRWAEIIDHQGQWFISLLDGKGPLTYWFLAVIRKVWSADPLLESRSLSVAAGLLSTVGVFAVGRRLAGETAGLLAAALYACFPYALLYDRIGYTESVVNLFGIAIVLTSLIAFEESGGPSRRDLVAGLTLGLGLFTKQTLFLFAFFPALAAVWLARSEPRRLIARLAIVYGIAAVPVVVSILAVPDAPTLETHDTLVHSTGFFVMPSELLANPFQVVPSNLVKLGGFVASYMTVPTVAAALASLGWLAWRGFTGAWVLASVSLVPLVAQVFVLELLYPSRYPFPHLWPWLVLLGWAGAEAWKTYGDRLPANRRHLAFTLAGLVAVGPLLYRAGGVLTSPRDHLYREDGGNFLGSSGQTGFGVREAVDYLTAESRNGPFVLLTDTIWGPPADPMFAYLNEKHGIRVYEAWWTQQSSTFPILPRGRAEVLRSHYERVEWGTVDFSQLRRVFYVTDTNFYTRAAVQVRQPGAQLAATFPKPRGEHSIDVYRLK